MLSWIASHTRILNVWVGIGTLLVWMFYAHLLYADFRRIRQAQILITQAWGNSIDSICLINNLSQEAFYLQDIILSLYTPDGVHRVSITDFEDASLEDATRGTSAITRQGPLSSEQYINIGTFRLLVRQAARLADLGEDQNQPVETLGIRGLKITVVAIYGPSGTLHRRAAQIQYLRRA